MNRTRTQTSLFLLLFLGGTVVSSHQAVGEVTSAQVTGLEDQMEDVQYEMDALAGQINDLSVSLQTMRVRMARMRLALERRTGREDQASEVPSNWRESSLEEVDFEAEDEMISDVCLSLARAFNNPQYSKVEMKALAQEARPILEALAEEGVDSRWRDEALFALAWANMNGPDPDYDQSLRYLQTMWEIRDRVSLEKELEGLSIYENTPITHVKKGLQASGLSDVDPAPIAIKMQLSFLYKKMGRIEDAIDALDAAYELAGSPESGIFTVQYEESRAELENQE